MKFKSIVSITAAVFTLTAGMLVPAVSAASENYPNQAIRLVVPFPPGGSSGLLARILADKMSSQIGQSIIVDSKPGAGGIIASTYVARAKPDGYTLLWGTAGTHGINSAIFSDLGYDPVTDFEAVGMAAGSPNVIVVNPDFSAKSIKDLIDLATADPGKYDAAVPNMATPHLMGEYFKYQTGIKLQTVPYQGSGPALIDTIAGHVPIMFDGLPSALPHIKSGKLRALGVSSLKRSASEPGIPAISETVPGFDSVAWWGLFAPAGTPAAIVELLNKEMNVALSSPDLQQRLAELGAEPVGGDSRKLADQVKVELDRWAEVVKASGIKSN